MFQALTSTLNLHKSLNFYVLQLKFIEEAKTNGLVLLCSQSEVDQEGFVCRQYHVARSHAVSMRRKRFF